MYSKNLSTKRINNDIKDIYNNPIEGIGIVSLNNDIMKYIVNIMLLSGPYKGYCLQLLLTFPDSYPINPPKILIYPNQLFDNLYHHHIFPDDKKDEDGNSFKKLCLDLLDNDFMSTKSEKTGWNPSYTISTLLMQVQSFLSDPDLSNNSMPKSHQIKELMDSMNNYQRNFEINDENGEIIKVHTWKDPYPKMYFKVNEISNEIDSLMSHDKKKIIKENLTCFITKSNFFDDHHIILGYPIVKENSGNIYPIPEILSYEGYLAQISNDYQEKFDFDFFGFNRKGLKSANNEYYDSWLPIFINEINFELHKQTILNSFSVLKFGNSGKEEYDFKPKYIFEIMLKLLNQMVTDMKNAKISNAYLRAFFQYILLYNKLSKLYPDDLNKYFNIDLFYSNDIYSTIGDFIIFTLLDKYSQIEKKLNELKELKKSEIAFEFFYEKRDCDLKSPKKFLQYLENNHIYSRIAKIMKSEKNMLLFNGKNINKRIKNILCNSFKKFIYYSDDNIIEKLKEIIVKNTKFNEYIEFEKFFKGEINDEIKEKIKEIFTKLSILLYIKKKINGENFMNELENNFGVYLYIDEVIKKLNEIITNIDNYFDKEIVFYDTIIHIRIKKLIEELLILDYRPTIKLKNLDSFKINFSFFENYLISYPLFHTEFKCKIKSNLFSKIIAMKIDNLRLLYLYYYERLKKAINRKNNGLSLIESKFIELSLNDKVDENYEWYHFICEKQKNDKENKEIINYNEFVCKNRDFISCFHDLVRLNEKLLLENFEINYSYFTRLPYLYKYILKITQHLLDTKVYWGQEQYNFRFYLLENSELDGSLKKIKEIYEARDITLLTFFELILIENINIIKYGFLSASKTQSLYNFTMKDIIKALTEKKSPMNNRINKKEKRLSKKSDNKVSKFKRSKRDIRTMKLRLWKKQVPIKTKKTKKYK